MILIDKHGGKHHASISKYITVGTHQVGAFTQNDSVATIQGFSLPPVLQGMGIGSALLQHLENEFHKQHVHLVRVAIPFEVCPIHAHFWKKHGYTQQKNVFSKQL